MRIEDEYSLWAPRPLRIVAVLIALAVGTGLGACDGARGGAETPLVLATVNGKEITSNRLDQMARPGKEISFSRQTAEQALDDLINEELLVQDAVSSGLDADPAIAASQAAASRKMLAGLAADRVLVGVKPVSAEDVRRYYEEHPFLYASRRLYQFVVFSLPAANVGGALLKELDFSHSVKRVRSVLDRYGVQYQIRTLTAASEDLPAGKLQEFADAVPGDLLVVEHGTEMFLMSVSGVTSAPVSYESARPLIEQQLAADEAQAMLERYFSQQRAFASIRRNRDALEAYLAQAGDAPLATVTAGNE